MSCPCKLDCFKLFVRHTTSKTTQHTDIIKTEVAAQSRAIETDSAAIQIHTVEIEEEDKQEEAKRACIVVTETVAPHTYLVARPTLNKEKSSNSHI